VLQALIHRPPSKSMFSPLIHSRMKVIGGMVTAVWQFFFEAFVHVGSFRGSLGFGFWAESSPHSFLIPVTTFRRTFFFESFLKNPNAATADSGPSGIVF